MNKLLQKLLEWLRRFEKPVDLEPDPKPPDPVPAPEGKWTIRAIWNKPTPRKVMFVRQFAGGVLVSSYDGKSRKNSWLDFRLPDGKWKEIYKGSDETLGPIGEFEGRYWTCAEKGKTVLRVNANGQVTPAARIPKDAEYNVFGTVWRNRPVFGGAADRKRNVPTRIYDAETGGAVVSLPLRGLVAGLCVDNHGVLWAISADGQQGLCNSTGHKITSVKPASVAHTTSLGLVFGGMEEGKVWSLEPRSGEIALLADLNCSKINRLYANWDQIYVAGANPDTFATIRQNRIVEIIARFEDEKQDRTGEQFDADIAPGPNGTILIARKSPKGAVVYEVSK